MGSVVLSYAGGDKYYHQNNQSYFLEFCSLCQKQIANNSDIYMYRGDTPFCSQECRQEQIEIDEAAERNRKRSSSSSKKAHRQTPSDSSNKQSKDVRRGIVAVA